MKIDFFEAYSSMRFPTLWIKYERQTTVKENTPIFVALESRKRCPEKCDVTDVR
jgi:hypothetical protein